MSSLKETLEKVRANRDLSVFDLLSIDDLTQKDIELILELAAVCKPSKTEKTDLLRGHTIINAFYENSTRTRTSFEIAGKNLGADTINISASGSSVTKGESHIDTAMTLAALQAQAVVIRTAESGVPDFIAKHIAPAVLNAGDGWHEHPSQALLDIMTMREHYKSLKNKVVTIIGDIAHSRVFGSLVRILNKEGAITRVVCPDTFLPEYISQFPVEVIPVLEDALPGTDVIYALRVQEERGAKGYIPSLREYSKTYGINPKRLAMAKPDAILMHPGPVIRDIDVHSSLVTHNQSRILEQVENGLAVRKAVLWLLCDRRDNKQKPYSLA